MLTINKSLEPINNFTTERFQKLEEFTHSSITEIDSQQLIMTESITKMEAKIGQIDKQYAPRSLVMKVEKKMTGIESKDLERKADLEEKVISILNANNVDYNHLLQKLNSTNASIATLAGDIHEVSNRAEYINIQKIRRIKFQRINFGGFIFGHFFRISSE